MGLIQKISLTTGIPQQKVLQYIMILGILFIVFGIGQAILTNLIGVAYPVFMSFYALESDGDDDDKQWLTYWVVFGMFSIADQFAGFILRFIPFYYVLKVATLIWLFHPATQGATFVYNNHIQPLWKEYEGQLEEVQKGLQKQLNDVASQAKAKASGLMNKQD